MIPSFNGKDWVNLRFTHMQALIAYFIDISINKYHFKYVSGRRGEAKMFNFLFYWQGTC